MFNRIIIGHVKGIVAAHDHLVSTIEFYQIFQLVIGKDDAVDPNLLEIVGRRFWQIGMAVLARAPGMVDSA